MAQEKRPIVIKLGSSSLASPEGGLDAGHMARLVDEFAALLREGRKLLVVTSGAIAAGKAGLGMAVRPRNIVDLQAVAAVGQVLLLQRYGELFAERGVTIGQILVTAHEMTDRVSYLNAKAAIERLLELDVLPIVNENDTVAVDEIRFGDNDTLAALVAVLVDATLLINLSDTPGLFTADPRHDAGARLIEEVDEITAELEVLAQGPGTEDGSGGMVTKLQAARIATSASIPMVIADSSLPGAVGRIIAGERIGTRFNPRERRLSSRKSWIAFGKAVRGTIEVDAGAAAAIKEKGTSLLPAGITATTGSFSPGDAVEIIGPDGGRFARGISNYSDEEIERIKGCKSSELAGVLGEEACEEVVHRDELVIL